MDCKLFTVTDEGTEMGFLAIRLDSDHKVTAAEYELLCEWGYHPDHRPGYMLLAEVKGGTPVKAGINQHQWDRGGTGYQAFIKILANWDELQSGDTVDVEQEREDFWETEAEREEASG